MNLSCKLSGMLKSILKLKKSDKSKLDLSLINEDEYYLRELRRVFDEKLLLKEIENRNLDIKLAIN